MKTLLDELREAHPTMAEAAKRSPVKAIRLFCLDCMGGNRADVAGCQSTGCPLHPFRAGTRAKAVASYGLEPLESPEGTDPVPGDL